MTMFDKAYSYDDLLLKPRYSEVESRDDVDLSTNITPNVEAEVPLISAPMDSVTGPEMAQAMADNGGVGILHRFEDWGTRCEWIEEVDGTVGASVGISNEDVAIAQDFEEHGADFICVDVAHGHLSKAVDFVEELDSLVDIGIMVGNVAAQYAVKDLVLAGADSVKVGVGPGSACTTREKTGHGVPQASAVRECADAPHLSSKEYTIVADGGIRKPGDAVKALMLGADSVMMGGTFGRCHESPGGGNVWGMASENGNDENYVEGEMNEGEEKYSVPEVFIEFEDGMRSGLSYSGGHDIKEARTKSKFVEITPSTQERNGSFEI